MRRIVFTVLAAALTLSSACKKQASDEASAGATKGSAAGATTGTTATGAAPGAGNAVPAATDTAAPAGATGSTATGTAPGAAAGSDTGAAAAGADTAAAGAGGAERMTHRAGMCPSMVLGATTTAAIKGKAVAVTIASTDKDAVTAIQKRTDKLLAEKKDGSSGTAHDQKGTHGGSQGLCPVYVPEGASATAARDAKGVVVMITPKENPDDLVKEITGRIAKASDWVKANVKDGDKGNQGGVGGGKGDDGSNHSGKGDGKGHERKKGGGGKGTGGGGGGGTGGGAGGGDKHS